MIEILDTPHEGPQRASLPTIQIGKHEVKAFLTGAMGVGFTGHKFAAAVSEHGKGAVPTLSAAGLCMIPEYRHTYMEEIAKARKFAGGSLTCEHLEHVFLQANLRCIALEILQAREKGVGDKPLFMNVMTATGHFAKQIDAACRAGINGLVCGAGLPLDLPGMTEKYPDVAIIPIVSNARGAKIIFEKWWKKFKRLPDAIVLEDPFKAGGHLGARNLEDEDAQDTKLERSIQMTRDLFEKLHIPPIPIIGAGGMVSGPDIKDVMGLLGADGVQLATIFIPSHEVRASAEVKRAILDAKNGDVFEYPSSIGILARALRGSPVFKDLGKEPVKARICGHKCLVRCGYMQGIQNTAQMCVMRQLAEAVEGAPKTGRGLWFTGTGAPRINWDEPKPVREIFDLLIT